LNDGLRIRFARNTVIRGLWALAAVNALVIAGSWFFKLYTG